LIQDEEEISIAGHILDLAKAEARNRESFDEKQAYYECSRNGDDDEKD